MKCSCQYESQGCLWQGVDELAEASSDVHSHRSFALRRLQDHRSSSYVALERRLIASPRISQPRIHLATHRQPIEHLDMSAGKKKSVRMLVKLVSLARTGFFYVSDHAPLSLLVTSFSLSDYALRHFLLQVAEKNPRNVPWKLKLMKYDPVVNKHVLFEEQKLK